MKRIATPNRAVDLFGAGKDGFRQAVPGASSATEFSALFFNHIQEAIVRTIEAAGLELSDGDYDQFTVAVRTLSGGRIATAAGTDDAITAEFTQEYTALTHGVPVYVRAANANATTTPTFKADDTAAKTIVKGNGLALVAGDIAGAGHWLELQFDTTLDKWVLQNPATGVSPGIQAASETVAGKIEIATAAETIALTDTSRAIVPANLLAGIRAALGVTGAAPIYPNRAWVTFNGTGTVAILTGQNVSSITDNGTGLYTVNFSTAMYDASYCYQGTARNTAASGSTKLVCGDYTTAPTVSALRVAVQTGDTNSYVDSAQVNIVVAGR